MLTINSSTYLKPVEISDAKTVFDLVNQSREYLAEWLPWVNSTKSPDDIINYYQTCIDRKKNNNGFELLIVEDDNIRGSIGLHKIDWENKLTSIGYWLDINAQGNGLMTKACERLISYCFNELNLETIEIGCAVGNEKSKKIPERLGFQNVGVLKEKTFGTTQCSNLILFTIQKSDWKR